MAKKIVLLADGTGNGLRVQVSNIARIMEALEISQDQVVCYIPGVGTESFLPLAWLDSAIGFGVPANVRRLYWFLSWHWEPDCEIYMFGFSRGAFTIRLLIEFIAKRGLLPRIHGSQLHRERAVMAAWNAFQATSETASKNLVHRLSNKIAYLFRLLSRYFYRSRFDYYHDLYAMSRHDVSIAFVGLFDTVDALGVPIEELRTVIHLLFFPVKFLDDHTIPRNVGCVRHALSLDDERLTFQPIRIAKEPNPSPGRIQEVWFAGVHSDVGGGYPDDMAAHVPLCWLLQEAFNSVEQDPSRVLKFHPGALDKFNELATSFGPLHSSRVGAGRIYRWAQRINQSYDPMGNPYCVPIVHHSVIDRLVDPNYDYEPLLITRHYAVWTPGGTLFTSSTDAIEKSTQSKLLNASDVESQVGLAEVAIRSLGTPNPGEMDIAQDYVWLNKIVYFYFSTFIVFIVAFPFLDSTLNELNENIEENFRVMFYEFGWLSDLLLFVTRSPLSSFGNIFRNFGDMILSLTPSFLYSHFKTALSHPFVSICLVLAYFALRHQSDAYRNAIRNHVRLAWNVKTDSKKVFVRRSIWAYSARAIRTWSEAGAVFNLRRSILSSTFAWLLILPAPFVANRISFNWLDRIEGAVCVSSPVQKWVSTASAPFATNNPCWASGWTLEQGAVYRLTISIDPRTDDPWLDQLILTDPYGYVGRDWRLSGPVVLRRWLSAAWFHPIARIGANGDAEWPLVPLDGGGPLSPGGKRCSRLPINYNDTVQHKSFCAHHHSAKSCVDGGLEVSNPLPQEELSAAKRAWQENTFYIDGNCSSAFPRRVFVSQFIASYTGELFLFVNDAVIGWSSLWRLFYANNTGSATVTIERSPFEALPTRTATAP